MKDERPIWWFFNLPKTLFSENDPAFVGPNRVLAPKGTPVRRKGRQLEQPQSALKGGRAASSLEFPQN